MIVLFSWDNPFIHLTYLYYLVKMAGIASMLKKTIGAILTLLMGVNMGDTVVTTITAVNTSAWTFTGHAAVAAVLNLIPLMYYGGVVAGAGMAFMYIN